MKIERKSIEIEGSCNFCNRYIAMIIADGDGYISHPYKYVTVVKTNKADASVRFCDDCIQELVNYISEVEE